MSVLRRITFLLSLAVVVLSGGPALAHTDLASSTPADGEVVADAPDRVTLVFGGPVEPVDGGVTLLDGVGEPMDAVVEVSADGTLAAVPAVPLDAGVYGVSWAVRAGDAHPKRGTFTFEVAPAEATETTKSEVVEADGEAAGGGNTDLPDDGQSVTGAVMDGTVAESTNPPPELAGVLAPPSSRIGRLVAWAGRTVAYVAVLAALGGFAFLLWAHEGSVGERRRLVRLVRGLGVIAVAATVVQVLGAAAVLDASLLGVLRPRTLLTVLSSSFGWGMALRVGGAALLTVGFADAAATRDGDVAEEELQAETETGGGGIGLLVRAVPAHVRAQRVRPTVAAVVGAVLLVVAFVPTGHSAVTEPRVLVVLSTLAHVAAAALWVGGVLFLAVTLARRARLREPLRAAPVALRTSTLAVVGLTVVALAGSALAWAELPDLGALFSSTYGRVLLAKLAAVGAAAGVGAYNHRTLLPLVTVDPDGAGAQSLRRVVRVELAAMGLVIALTGGLVALGGMGE